jgi:hypothetical protein
LKTDGNFSLGGDALGRVWPESAQARFVWACIFTAGAFSLAFALAVQAWRVEALSQSTAAQANAAAANLAKLSHPTPDSSNNVPRRHPALSLGAQQEAGAVVHRLEQAARALDVIIRRIEVAQVPPSATELGRLQLAVVAEGTYADLKRWMAEWTARLPSATIAQLRLQRAESAAETQPLLEWSGSITVWSRPSDPVQR